jgi:hypothetical protein
MKMHAFTAKTGEPSLQRPKPTYLPSTTKGMHLENFYNELFPLLFKSFLLVEPLFIAPSKSVEECYSKLFAFFFNGNSIRFN